jgi:hypothetical protein
LAQKFLDHDPIGFDIGGQFRRRRGVGQEGGVECARGKTLHGWPAHAGISEKEIFAGDTAFGAGEVECDGVQVGAHAAETDRGIEAVGEQAEPHRQVVEHIHGGDVQNPPLGAEGEGEDGCGGELAAGKRSDIRADSKEEIFAADLPASRRRHPVARMKSPMASGLRTKTRKRGYTE